MLCLPGTHGNCLLGLVGLALVGAGPAWAGVGQALVGLPGLAGDCLGWWGGWDFKDGRSNTEGVGQALVGGKSH